MTKNASDLAMELLARISGWSQPKFEEEGVVWIRVPRKTLDDFFKAKEWEPPWIDRSLGDCGPSGQPS